MSWFSLENVDFVGVAVATLAAFTVSYLWFHPRAAGAARARLAGTDPDELRSVTATRAAAAMVAFALTALAFNVLQAELLIVSIGGGLAFGVFVGVVLRLAWGVLHVVNERRSVGLAVLDGVHDVVTLAVIGAVVGAFL